jgi:tRNA threonylcarbamoyladenosine biosynthesis protein TsaE
MTEPSPNSDSVQFAHSHALEICTRSESETLDLGATLAQWLRAGDVALLHGDLGAGKTALAKGIARGLLVNAPVTSPSFALINEYPLPPGSSVSHLYHLDLYRLDTLEELETIGFYDIIAAPAAVTLVEWPERALGALPDRFLLIEITAQGDSCRGLSFSGSPADTVWQQRLADLARLVRHTSGAGAAQ